MAAQSHRLSPLADFPALGLARGIQRSAQKLDGHYAYRLILSTGEVGSWYRARLEEGEDDADVVVMLEQQLRSRDPVRHLALVKPSGPRYPDGVLAARTSLLLGRPFSARTSPPPVRSVRA